ncbi:MAG TPA: hypothetical protein VF069_21695 [Streptosporangiaceae bacterium]
MEGGIRQGGEGGGRLPLIEVAGRQHLGQHALERRLRAIFEVAYFTPQSVNRIEPTLAAEADHPIIAPVLRRVTAARLSFLTELYADLGLDPDTARQRALYSYSAFLGWLQLRRTAPDLAPETTHEGRRANPFLDDLARMLTSGAPGPTPP